MQKRSTSYKGINSIVQYSQVANKTHENNAKINLYNRPPMDAYYSDQ